MINLKLSKKIFNPIYLKHAIQNQNSRQVYFGGSSSGKSFFLAQRVILDILTTSRNYLICRETLNSLRKSTWNEIRKAIQRFKIQQYFSINKTEMIITCNINQNQILFVGLDDTEKVKSITPIRGVITDIWIEEATQVSRESYKQLEKRLRGFSKDKKRITLSFNPVLKNHWIYTEFFHIYIDNQQYVEKNDVSILKTNYKDNAFLTKDDIEKLENETDKYYYEVYTLGNWGVLGALIFTNYFVQEFEFESFDNLRNGLDWGFGVDPLAFARLHIDKKKKEIYIFDELYMTELPDEEAAEMIKEKINKNEIVTCDSSEPKSIANYRKLKINAVAAKKGPGSIETGIKFLQSFKIYIHPRCTNTKNEFSTYKWKEDRNGNVLPVPIDKNNHIIDAIRYAIESDIVEKQKMIARKNVFF